MFVLKKIWQWLNLKIHSAALFCGWLNCIVGGNWVRRGFLRWNIARKSATTVLWIRSQSKSTVCLMLYWIMRTGASQCSLNVCIFLVLDTSYTNSTYLSSCVHMQVSVIRAPVRSLSLYFCLGDQQWQHWFMGVRNLGCCHGNATLQYCVQADRACCSVDTRTRARTVSVAGETCWMLISSSTVCPSSDQRNTQDLHYMCALTLSLYIFYNIYQYPQGETFCLVIYYNQS